ncbi:RING/U-box superfamily protein [Striga asiatica]|uniref:RBR-type E3 ubiquitin transferase n=1 Tax=Striga asiatica TaxID=4170 RepID=A0A5A7QWU0_STRAF|nr:RING/U-box superfamily protein [Striga asiatica]
MEDYYNTEDEEDYYSTDGEAESVNGLENDDVDAHRAQSKSNTCKVCLYSDYLSSAGIDLLIYAFWSFCLLLYQGYNKRVSLGCAGNKPCIVFNILSGKKEDLRRVMELLSVKEHHARTLLIHYRWDVENLISVYVEKGRSCIFADAGISIVIDLDPEEPPSTVMCNICMDDVAGQDVTLMDCGWTEHFIVKINEGQSKRIRCMAHKCNAICDEAVVRRLVSSRNPDLVEKFDRFLLESYIEDNKMVKWCPSVPHCGNALRVESDEFCEVECSCGFQFCFSCLLEAHSPCSCLMWQLWTKKCQDESETVNWITVHTKPCPKCYKPVEKNGGCNLVSCVCGQSWLCGGATGRNHTWTSIANHSCGRFKEDTVKKAERAKRDLYRYTHYYSRYKAHVDSLKQESRLRETMKEKVSVLEARDSNLKDFTWVTNGLYRLFRSRRALSYSYPFAFYMFGDEMFKGEMKKKHREIKKNLFEDQQQQLEANIERLSKFLEEPFNEYSDEQVMQTRMQVINLSLVVDNLCKKMHECIENDLLGALQYSIHIIAPYHSEGVEKAEELIDGFGSNSENLKEAKDQASGSGTSGNDNQQISRKRARDSLSDSSFDLNAPEKSQHVQP